jgi:hypothetical protein
MNRPSLENLGTRPLFDLFGEWPLETKKNIAVAEHHQDLAVLVELEDFLTKHGAIVEEKRMRSEPSPTRSRTRGQRIGTGLIHSERR